MSGNTDQTNNDFRPTATLQALQRRAHLLIELRDSFASEGYWEVETPLLSHDCCIDPWIEPFRVLLAGGGEAFLQTSPEFAMKRLLASGAERIFQVSKAFRQEEAGPLHNAEFTMIEWYARDCDHHAQMDLVETLVRRLDQFTRDRAWAVDRPSLPETIVRINYEQAFQKFAGFSPANISREDLLSIAANYSPKDLLQQADVDDLLNLILAERVEPALKTLRAVFLYDYPASQSALAKIRPGDPAVAERFELYLDGIEICNGYHELTDESELRTRMQRLSSKRHATGIPPLPVESRLLSAMQHGLPASAGVALGWDRLVMWLLNQTAIADVLAFPWERA